MLDDGVLADEFQENGANVNQVAEVGPRDELRLFFRLLINRLKLLVKFLVAISVLKLKSTALNYQIHVLGILIKVESLLMHREVLWPAQAHHILSQGEW